LEDQVYARSDILSSIRFLQRSFVAQIFDFLSGTLDARGEYDVDFRISLSDTSRHREAIGFPRQIDLGENDVELDLCVDDYPQVIGRDAFDDLIAAFPQELRDL